MECMSDSGANNDELVQAVVTLLRAVSTGAAAVPKPKARKLLRVSEVAEQLAISETHVRTLIRSGEIRGVKLGGALRVAPSEVDRIMASSEAS